MSKLVRPEAFINWFVWGMLQHASFNGENIIDIYHQHNSKSLEFNPARTFSEAQTFCRPALLLSIVCVHLPQCPLVLRAKIGCCLLTGIRLCTCSDNSSCFDYWYIDILIYFDILIYWYIDILMIVDIDIHSLPNHQNIMTLLWSFQPLATSIKAATPACKPNRKLRRHRLRHRCWSWLIKRLITY